ncbi:hypothetical protein M422DRAFT_250047 [Sphaerobolus stellatus SS14]|nr:hypothetical protein M422DRAFT_250047 [Sphaerobolus stellatus SS14]
MASSSNSTLQTLAQETSASFAHVYVQFAALTLLVYDTLLTFPSELKFVWKGKLKLGTILYLFTRYSAILDITVVGIGSSLLSTYKVSLEFLRPDLQQIDEVVNRAFSVIIVCRFMLDLLRANSHPNGTLTGHSTRMVSTGRIAVIFERVEQIILNEFGNDIL